MITVVHFHSESGDHYLEAFDGEVDTYDPAFWEKVYDVFGDETEYLHVMDTMLITKEDFA